MTIIKLIPFLTIENSPFWLVWLDWNFYAYWPSLTIISSLSFIIWVIYCFFNYGGSVG